jgi:pyruvate formate lyase activating enzyme
MVGERMSIDDVMSAVLADRIFYDDSGGGVTFSGGEPLLQPDFLRGLLTACRTQDLHTAIDTCGFAEPETLLALTGLADLVLYDLKMLDDDEHQRHTGGSNRVILENLQALARHHRNVWIRIPVVPGCNEDQTRLDEMARFVAQLPGVTQVNLLPYHRLHEHKSAAACRQPESVPSPTAEAAATCQPQAPLKTYAELFRRRGLNTVVGG